ncbi:prephenate dehydratase [Alkalilimnicola sp. S0819]|uniref:prephenate dehydratase n=1 Tax=Alkalilimnicola sp. S0819 TaxID=2613922 RepID=UPI001261C083|nr:prephenate dehydratase [Alkalilimnicola sp. S0819]KAB7623663.1 prephenate dehydratase [Alkalilimnicola sp. S0819]MPQ16787.1 prephenate dehydratase [Alkalilimnicola sp. S0819]
MSEADKLQKVREQIDTLDGELLALFNRRAELAAEVARIKREAGEKEDFYRPEREAAILRRVRERNPGPLAGEQVAVLFREVMSACLALQQPVKVAYLGPEGTYTNAAAVKHFGHGMLFESLPAIDTVFREVESGNVQYGVVPVENSTEGVVTHTLDRFMSSPLQIIGEVELPIHHNLCTLAEQMDDIRTVYSHQQALGQCRGWLDLHLPRAERVAVSSTAEAARLAAENPQAAAIASEVAADKYALSILHARVQDGAINTTRFLVLGQQSPPPTGNDKTSLVVSRVNKSGGLATLLAPLARYGLDMSRIESRPSRQGQWEYVFFIDILGHAEDTGLKRALGEMERVSSLFKVLGSYPRAAH